MVRYLSKESSEMAILRAMTKRIWKKARAATLIESLVASVIIIAIFTIASLTLNNVFKGSIDGNHSDIENRLNELEYLLLHDKIVVPYTEGYKEYQISISKTKEITPSIYIMEYRKDELETTRQRVIYD